MDLPPSLKIISLRVHSHGIIINNISKIPTFSRTETTLHVSLSISVLSVFNTHQQGEDAGTGGERYEVLFQAITLKGYNDVINHHHDKRQFK